MTTRRLEAIQRFDATLEMVNMRPDQKQTLRRMAREMLSGGSDVTFREFVIEATSQAEGLLTGGYAAVGFGAGLVVLMTWPSYGNVAAPVAGIAIGAGIGKLNAAKNQAFLIARYMRPESTTMPEPPTAEEEVPELEQRELVRTAQDTTSLTGRYRMFTNKEKAIMRSLRYGEKITRPLLESRGWTGLTSYKDMDGQQVTDLELVKEEMVYRRYANRQNGDVFWQGM